MKLVFDRKGLVKEYPYSRVIAIPTTAKEKNFFDSCKNADRSNYKFWVYKRLYELDNLVIDNPMADEYDEDGNLIYDSDSLFSMMCDMTRGGDYSFAPKPSNLCILSLYYTLAKRHNKVRRLNLLYKRMISLWFNQSIVANKEKDDNNDDTQ